ncbi:MAG: winged helix-turn-helix domain-containing protein [Euryarchaeota archaeon]
MFDLRLEEIPLPAGKKDRDKLISWLIDTLCLHRRREDSASDENGFYSPIHRILSEHLLKFPDKGFETRELAIELGLTPAAIHHHFARLVSAGLVSTTSGKGWKIYYIVGGSIPNAIENMRARSNIIHQQRISILDEIWNRGKNTTMKIETPPDGKPSTLIRVKEWGPLEGGENEISRFMADIGLLGERPGRENHADSLSVKIFQMLLASGPPISIDESAEKCDGAKPRVGRILERFRGTGLIERIARTDRLSSALWSAMTTQYMRRGEDWLLKKGGFQRLSVPNNLLKHLKNGTCTPEKIASSLKSFEPRDQMLLLNLLGGRLPLGYRLVGNNVESMKRKSTDDLDRIFRRIQKVGKTLSELNE